VRIAREARPQRAPATMASISEDDEEHCILPQQDCD
jgi:hypothetical protein